MVVLNDGGGNQIWKVGVNHSPEAAEILLIGEVPVGYEPTGITCTPDEKYWFLSLQGKSMGMIQKDKYGQALKWDKPTTIVIQAK